MQACDGRGKQQEKTSGGHCGEMGSKRGGRTAEKNALHEMLVSGCEESGCESSCCRRDNREDSLHGDNCGYNTQLLYFTCSSLNEDDTRIYLITDRDGHPNVMVRELETGEERILMANRGGTLKSYVYFDGSLNQGLGKASVCLDSIRDIIYYIQDDKICKVNLAGEITELALVPNGRMTAFTHVSRDGKYLCVPMTDGRCLDFDPETEGSGLDRRPMYDIDGRVQEENLNSCLCVYSTETGELLYEKTVPKCWITHVQFNPVNPEQIMYNHEWSSFSCGIRRIWLYDHETDTIIRVRTEGSDTLGNTRGFLRRKEDWVCGTLEWIPLCRHKSDWLGQDAHPHPIYSHAGDRVFYNSRWGKTVNVYCVSVGE